MRRAVRFLARSSSSVCALLALGALVVAAPGRTRGWFERDLALRAQLAVDAARDEPRRATGAGTGRGSPDASSRDITRDERIMAAAACGARRCRSSRATDDYPAAVLVRGPCATRGRDGAATGAWTTSVRLRRRDVHVSAIPARRRRARRSASSCWSTT